MNIRELIEQSVSKNLAKICIYFEDQEISYRQLDNNINRVANGLLGIGVRKGNRVCLMLPNCLEFIYSWLGLNKIGAIMVPINTAFKTEEMKYILNHSESMSLIVDHSFLDLARKVRGECDYLQHVICLGEKPSSDIILFSKLIYDSPSTLEPVDITDDDVATQVYTSGTTGFPKGVMQTHGANVLTGEYFIKGLGLTAEDRLMVILPLFHANAQFFSTMGCLTVGASLVLIPKFSASRFWEQTRQYKATEVNTTGPINAILYHQRETENDRDNPIKLIYSGAVPKDIMKPFDERFGVTTIEGYGLTECPGICKNPAYGIRKIGSLGVPVKYTGPDVGDTGVKIVDEHDSELSPNKIGEIVAKTPSVMKGYFKDPEKTAEAMRNGWFHTGDLGFVDEDGYFWFVDRQKDIIRRRGENISSVEVENVINMHSSVQEAAIVPVKSGFGEDDVKACVILKPEEVLSPQDLIEWCKERIAYFKVPRYVKYYKSFHKTATGRIEKHLLRSEENPLEGCFDREASS